MKTHNKLLLSILTTPFIPLTILACSNDNSITKKQEVVINIAEEMELNNSEKSYFSLNVTNLPVKAKKISVNISSIDGVFLYSKNQEISNFKFETIFSISKNIKKINVVINIDDVEVKQQIFDIQHTTKPFEPIEPNPNPELIPEPKPKPNPNPNNDDNNDGAKQEIGSLFNNFNIQINVPKFPSQLLENEVSLKLNNHFFNINIDPKIPNPQVELKALSFNDFEGTIKLQAKIISGEKIEQKIYEFKTNLLLNSPTEYMNLKITNLNILDKNISEYVNFLNDKTKSDQEKITKLKELGNLEIINNSPLKSPRITIESAQEKNNILTVKYTYNGYYKLLIEGQNKIEDRFYNFYQTEFLNIGLEQNFKEIFDKVKVKANFEKGTTFPSWFNEVFKKESEEKENLFDTGSTVNNYYHGKPFWKLNTGFHNIQIIFNKKYHREEYIGAFISYFFDIPEYNVRKFSMAVKSIDAFDDKEGTLDVTLVFLEKTEDANGHYFSGKEIYEKKYKITGLNKWSEEKFNDFHIMFWLDANDEKLNSSIDTMLRLNKRSIANIWETENEYEFNVSSLNKDLYNKWFNFLYKEYGLSLFRSDLYPFPIYWWDDFYNNFHLNKLYIRNKKLYADVTFTIKIQGFEPKTFNRTFFIPVYKNVTGENYTFNLFTK
ncbi:hypothetical protein ACW95P_02810 [Candidatus Mycoplasma pogonae]